MISLKKYLDMDAPGPSVAMPQPEELLAATLTCYRSALLAVGKSAAQACPALGANLDESLQTLEQRVAVNPSLDLMRRTEEQVEDHLQEWGARTSDHFKGKTDEVKELIIALAKAAESVGSRDEGYSNSFSELTKNLEGIANLDDLTQIRVLLVKRVTDLKRNIDQMTRESHQLVTQLRAQVSLFETKLKKAEHLVLTDALTGVANRRSVEERIRLNIESNEAFAIIMLDINHFKQVNDEHGHLVGDSLLKQFATELRLNTRSGDLVGRWGGDEFIVVISGDRFAANMSLKRLEQWVFGKYTLQNRATQSTVELQVEASIGIAEWKPGQTLEHVIGAADSDMYVSKKRLHKLKAS